MKRLLITTLCCLMSGLWAMAQQMETHERLNADGYNFWFYTPGGENRRATDSLVQSTDTLAADTLVRELPDGGKMQQQGLKPLVVFLHGQSICGGSIKNVLRYGTLDALRRGRDIDAFVVAPHNPGGRWVPSKVLDLVDWAIENYPVDSCRVYVLGMSLGGFGTINVAAAYPDRFAAAMALCGGGNNPSYPNLNRIPLWILHGTADRAVRISDSDEVVAGMRKAGKPERLLYNRLKGKNHSILARCFYMPQTYKWLFAHSLADSARTICKDYDIVDADFGRAYSDLHEPTWTHIREVNHMKNDGYERGNRKGRGRSDDGGSGVYTVRKGDTLSGIAHRYHTNVARLCRLNGLKRTSTLRIGQKIKY